MTKEQEDFIRGAAAKDGRLSCEAAHELAKELGVTLEEIGRFCDDNGIRIKDCQLGCF